MSSKIAHHSVVHARADVLNEPLPASRLAEELFDAALAAMIFEEHLVKDRIAHLHVDQKFVMFICVGLHTLMPLLKLVVFSSKSH